MNTQVSNPFGNSNQITLPQQANALIESESQRSVAEVQAAMAIAKRFPRNQVAAMDSILNACQRPSLANTALYQYARGGSSISGPSIRLAEAMAQQWGNIQYGIRELSQNNGESTVEAFAWDIETNTKQVKVFQVPHVRYTKKGSYPLKDPRDIYETVANNGARRLRACILGVIPSDVVDAAVSQCYQTMQANTDCSPSRVSKLVDAFSKFGVDRKAVEKRIQCRIEAIKPAQVISLIQIGESLRDGVANASDFFDVSSNENSVSSINDAVVQAVAEIEKPKPVEKEQSQSSNSEYQNIMTGIKACATLDDVERMQSIIADKATEFGDGAKLLQDTLNGISEEIGAAG